MSIVLGIVPKAHTLQNGRTLWPADYEEGFAKTVVLTSVMRGDFVLSWVGF